MMVQFSSYLRDDTFCQELGCSGLAKWCYDGWRLDAIEKTEGSSFSSGLCGMQTAKPPLGAMVDDDPSDCSTEICYVNNLLMLFLQGC
jgi:hypothetical protein